MVLLKLTTLFITGAVFVMSCKKQTPYHQQPGPDPKPNPPVAVPLKDIVIPNLPAPYYHFEYDQAGKPVVLSFANNLMLNTVLYDANGRISEMRNAGTANKDTIRYNYDNAGKVISIEYTDITGRMYVHITFSYDGQQLVQITRRRIFGNSGFVVNKIMSFTYYADGNLEEMVDQRPAISGQAESATLMRFELYDDKINVDDFDILHNDFFDDLWILPGLKLQKNNPRKVIVTSSNSYTADFTYTYNERNFPLTKKGNVLLTTGNNAGQRFQTTTEYSYY